MATVTATPSTVVSAGAWTDVANTYASDDTYATLVAAADNVGYPFEVGGYDYSAIPADAVISSVTGSVEFRLNFTSSTTTTVQAFVGATAVSNVETMPASGSDSARSFTFTGVTVAHLRDPAFRLRVTASKTTGSRVWYVDVVGPMTVTYTSAYVAPDPGAVLIVTADGALDTQTTYLRDRLVAAGDTVTVAAFDALPADRSKFVGIIHATASVTPGAYDAYEGLVLATHWQAAGNLGMHTYGGGGGGPRRAVGIYGTPATLLPVPDPAPGITALTAWTADVITAHMGSTIYWGPAARVAITEQVNRADRIVGAYYPAGSTLPSGLVTRGVWAALSWSGDYGLLNADGSTILDRFTTYGRSVPPPVVSGPPTGDVVVGFTVADSTALPAPLVEVLPGLAVNSGYLVVDVTGTRTTARVTTDLTSTHRARLFLGSLDGAGSTATDFAEVAALTRVSSDGTSYYGLFASTAPGRGWELRSVAAGTDTVLAGDETYAVGTITDGVLDLLADGPILRGYIEGVEVSPPAGWPASVTALNANVNIGVRAFARTPSRLRVSYVVGDTVTPTSVTPAVPAAPTVVLNRRSWFSIIVDLPDAVPDGVYLKAYQRPAGATAWTVDNPQFNGEQHSFTGLTHDTLYDLAASAVNADTGEESSLATLTDVRTFVANGVTRRLGGIEEPAFLTRVGAAPLGTASLGTASLGTASLGGEA